MAAQSGVMRKVGKAGRPFPDLLKGQRAREMKYKYLLFDLDGTLTDPKEGITSSVQYALRSFGIEEPDLNKLTPFIGPPLKDSFREFYGFDEGQAEEAVAKYREWFAPKGIFQNEIYAGIPQMLLRLKEKGKVLAVASSKPQVFVEKILDYFGIHDCFTVVVGSELDGTRGSKEEVVEEALRQLRETAEGVSGRRQEEAEGMRSRGQEEAEGMRSRGQEEAEGMRSRRQEAAGEMREWPQDAPGETERRRQEEPGEMRNGAWKKQGEMPNRFREELKEGVCRQKTAEGEKKVTAVRDTVMVGDRKFDIEGGRRHGLVTVGVAFGYAEEGELEAAGADFVAGTVEELGRLLEE